MCPVLCFRRYQTILNTLIENNEIQNKNPELYSKITEMDTSIQPFKCTN